MSTHIYNHLLRHKTDTRLKKNLTKFHFFDTINADILENSQQRGDGLKRKSTVSIWRG